MYILKHFPPILDYKPFKGQKLFTVPKNYIKFILFL